MKWFERPLKDKMQGHAGIHALRVAKDSTDMSANRRGCTTYKKLGIRMILSPVLPLISVLLILLNSLQAEATFSGKLKSMSSSCHLLC